MFGLLEKPLDIQAGKAVNRTMEEAVVDRTIPALTMQVNGTTVKIVITMHTFSSLNVLQTL